MAGLIIFELFICCSEGFTDKGVSSLGNAIRCLRSLENLKINLLTEEYTNSYMKIIITSRITSEGVKSIATALKYLPLIRTFTLHLTG